LEIDNKAIGLRIRKEREKFKLTREEFAGIIGISEYYIGQLERGERQMSLPVMVRISNKLLVSLDYLVFGKTARDNRDNKEHEKTCICDEARDIYKEINFILERCSATELKFILKIIVTILPYISIK
jgi:transcriptional regulator with XRE-family HTH domain